MSSCHWLKNWKKCKIGFLYWIIIFQQRLIINLLKACAWIYVFFLGRRLSSRLSLINLLILKMLLFSVTSQHGYIKIIRLSSVNTCTFKAFYRMNLESIVSFFKWKLTWWRTRAKFSPCKGFKKNNTRNIMMLNSIFLQKIYINIPWLFQ